MEKRRRRDRSPEEDGNLVVALLLAPMLFALCMALWSIGEQDYSEAAAWGIALVVACRWLGEAERP